MDTRIILSFAMAHGGWTFSHWLWDRLRRHYRLFDVAAIYNDYIVSADIEQGPDTRMRRVVDPRAAMSSTSGSRPIGTQRDDWNDLYRAALASARVAVLVVTRDSIVSEWCNKEAGQILDEQADRRTRGAPDLRLVVLSLVATDVRITHDVFPDARIVVATPYADFDRTRSDDRPQDFEPLLWGEEDWKITDAAWQELLAAIGRVD